MIVTKKSKTKVDYLRNIEKCGSQHQRVYLEEQISVHKPPSVTKANQFQELWELHSQNRGVWSKS
jgi:hypothetical protein